MPAAPDATAEHIRDVNIRYHDAAAESYDAKWGIDFGELGRDQVRRKVTKALGHWPGRPFGDSLEIGAGTGYFTLNLLQLGLVERATATDISPGMLASLQANAARLDLAVEVRTGDAESMPFCDESFDLVFAHAVLHHIPDLGRALGELARVLRPGGVIAFAGEPSRHGDRLAAAPKAFARALAPLWRRAIGASELTEHPEGATGHRLEAEVDVHAFDPAALRALIERAGFAEARVQGEELLANMYGWGVRGLEATAAPDQIPARWRSFAFRSYLALQELDARLLEPNLPGSLFYNLLGSARKPASASGPSLDPPISA